MKKFASRKFIVTLLGLCSATVAAYSDIPTETQSGFFDFVGTMLTFFLVGQGAVDVSGRVKGFKES